MNAAVSCRTRRPPMRVGRSRHQGPNVLPPAFVLPTKSDNAFVFNRRDKPLAGQASAGT